LKQCVESSSLHLRTYLGKLTWLAPGNSWAECARCPISQSERPTSLPWQLVRFNYVPTYLRTRGPFMQDDKAEATRYNMAAGHGFNCLNSGHTVHDTRKPHRGRCHGGQSRAACIPDVLSSRSALLIQTRELRRSSIFSDLSLHRVPLYQYEGTVHRCSTVAAPLQHLLPSRPVSAVKPSASIPLMRAAMDGCAN
jgi:hypothetical protein